MRHRESTIWKLMITTPHLRRPRRCCSVDQPGGSLHGQRRIPNAAKDYTQAIEMAPKRTHLLHQRAIAYKAAGDFGKASDDFTTLIKRDPNDFAAIMGRGYIRFQQQNHKQAVKDFSAAIQLKPEDPVALNNRGFNLRQLGNHEEALRDFDAAIKYGPKYSLAYQNRAWLLATAEDDDIRDPKRAVKSAKEACELTNYESIADIAALAAALAADDNFKDAVGWQEKVVEMAADSKFSDFAKKILKRYQKERLFDPNPDVADARDEAAEKESILEKEGDAKREKEDEIAAK